MLAGTVLTAAVLTAGSPADGLRTAGGAVTALAGAAVPAVLLGVAATLWSRAPGGRPATALRAGAAVAATLAVGTAVALLAPGGLEPPVALALAAVLAVPLACPGGPRRASTALARGRATTAGVPAGGPTAGQLLLGVCVLGLLCAPAAPPPPATAAHPAGPGDVRMFPLYAERLGLAHATVALPRPAAAGRPAGLTVVRLDGAGAGRTAGAAGTAWTGSGEALLAQARPEFLRVTGPLAVRTGLTAERLTDRGYRPLARRGAGGDWVHRSAVTVPERLPALRRLARDGTTQLTRTAHVR